MFEEWNNWPEEEKEEQSFMEHMEVFVYERAKGFYTDPDNDFMEEVGGDGLITATIKQKRAALFSMALIFFLLK